MDCRSCSTCLPFKVMLCQKCGDWTPNDGVSTNITNVSLAKTTTLDQIEAAQIERVITGGPWDECWGGGCVRGCITLLGSMPGMGKTTLTLQLSSLFAKIRKKVAYFISAEQSPGEIRLTAQRLLIDNLQDFRVMREFGAGGDIDEALLKAHPPACVVLDSVSALCGRDVHEATKVARNWKKIAVKYNTIVFLISHMSKEGDFAGLMTLQHDVDSLVTLFGLKSEQKEESLLREGYSAEAVGGMRELRAWKNRYGPTGKDYFLMIGPHGLTAIPELPKKEKKGSRRKSTVSLSGVGLDPVEGVPLPFRKDSFKRPVADAILMPDGQKLVRVPREGRAKVQHKAHGAVELLKGLGNHSKPLKATVKEITAAKGRAAAVEGEALKKRRPPMLKTKPVRNVKAARSKPVKAVKPVKPPRGKEARA